jgi:hypothetical protein
VEAASTPYVVLGAVAAGQRRSRQLLSIGGRVAAVAARPAELGWRSPLAAPLRSRVERTTEGLAREGEQLVQRYREQASSLARRLAEQMVGSGLADQVIERALSSGAFDNVVTVVIEHPTTEAALASALDSPALERLIARVMDSRLIDEVVSQLLESEQMRVILDYVTRSPEMRAALAHTTAGLAGDMAVGVRARTVRADDAAEHFARTLLRRPRQNASS